MQLIRADAEHSDWDAIHRLIHRSFAYMERRLGHPPHALSTSAAQLAQEARTGTVFLMTDDNTPVACLFCRTSLDHPDALYLGKLAVATEYRGVGLARQLVDAAVAEARDRGFVALTLDTGEELSELHRVFQRLGFDPPRPRSGEAGVVTMMRQL